MSKFTLGDGFYNPTTTWNYPGSRSSRREALVPLLQTPCVELLDEWQKNVPEDVCYARGLSEIASWAILELQDKPFQEMDEDEQRSIDAWCFSLQRERRVRPSPIDSGEARSVVDEGGLLSAILVNQIGQDSRFYWPTVRLMHLALRPTRGPSEAGPWIMRACEDVISFCDANKYVL